MSFLGAPRERVAPEAPFVDCVGSLVLKHYALPRDRRAELLVSRTERTEVHGLRRTLAGQAGRWESLTRDRVAPKAPLASSVMVALRIFVDDAVTMARKRASLSRVGWNSIPFASALPQEGKWEVSSPNARGAEGALGDSRRFVHRLMLDAVFVPGGASAEP